MAARRYSLQINPSLGFICPPVIPFISMQTLFMATFPVAMSDSATFTSLIRMISHGVNTLFLNQSQELLLVYSVSTCLSIDFKVTSLTDWAALLKINPLFAILSSFKFGDTSGVGTFYDFLSAYGISDVNHFSSPIYPLKNRIKKPKTKVSKANSVEKVSWAASSRTWKYNLSHWWTAYASFFQLYKNEFLDRSGHYSWRFIEF